MFSGAHPGSEDSNPEDLVQSDFSKREHDEGDSDNSSSAESSDESESEVEQ